MSDKLLAVVIFPAFAVVSVLMLFLRFVWPQYSMFFLAFVVGFVFACLKLVVYVHSQRLQKTAKDKDQFSPL